MRRTLITILALSGSGIAQGASADGFETVALFGDFAPGWRANWREQSLFAKPTRYDVAIDDGKPVLRAASRSANAGLVREIVRPLPVEARLKWRWKVRSTLANNTRERERAGDDYAARVFVVFETSAFPLRTRAINYVWAATEKTGAAFASPYTKNVGLVVLRSGNAEAGQWRTEERDVIADYRAHFGEPPSRISAVAVLSDTDNTKSEAEAWFADLVLATRLADVPAARAP
jgi:hypothetical protein